jgi:molybdopterin/thiamine biosynthesis adenylyltransferase
MPEDLYSRQVDLNLYIPREITIVGCGGIGSWAAIFAAMSGVPYLYLFDPDVIEESNRNRLPFCQGAIGRPKVEVTAEFIRAIRPDAVVVPIQEKLEDILLDIQLNICYCFLDCTDSPKAQANIYKKCKEIKATYIRAGYDGTHITVTSTVSGWIKSDVEQENYQVNPSWVVPAATVAALAIGKLMKFHHQEIGLDLNEIGIPIVEKQKRLTARCSQPGIRR